VRAFDKKFGLAFMASVPITAGIYLVFNLSDELIYVGKAKNLRRRLGQYRNAKRRKRHLKMRSIVADAAKIEIESHPTELSACLAEAKIIQELHPKWNVAGAFYFLYPMIGLAFDGRDLRLIYTTEPESIASELAKEFSFHGAFRSRFLCGSAFFALIELLEYIGHKNKTQKLSKHTYLYSFRQIDALFTKDLDLLLRGESSIVFERLVLSLVENASARRKPKEIQKLLNELKRFWRFEAELLFRVRTRVGNVNYPVPQKQRDLLFVENRYRSSSHIA
jgi:predicted GIY-YIG superfamily endonuclease